MDNGVNVLLLFEQSAGDPPEDQDHVVALGGDGGVLGVAVAQLAEEGRALAGAAVHREEVVGAGVGAAVALQVELSDVELHAAAELHADVPHTLHLDM